MPITTPCIHYTQMNQSELDIEHITFAPQGPGGTPYNGLHGEAPPERDTFFRLQVYKRVGISQAEVYKRVRRSAI